MFPLEHIDSIKDGFVRTQFEQLRNYLVGFLTKEHNSDGTHQISIPSGIVPVGMVADFAMASPPTAWLLCDGSAYNRVQYKSLFEAIGTTYGVPSGSTFSVPDARGKFRLGVAVSGTGSTLGATGGAIDHTHSGGSHTHSFSGTGTADSGGSHTHGVSGSTGTKDGGTSEFLEAMFGTGHSTPVDNHTHSVSLTSDSGGSHGHSVSVSGTTGSASGTTGTANPPFIATTVCIYAGV